MEAMKDVGFAKGFACGLGYAGADMVTNTGEALAGAGKFMGRGLLGIGVAFHWAWNWGTGQDTWEQEEMIIALGEPNAEVVDEALQAGKFLGTLLLDTAAIYPKVELGLLTGDLEMVRTALHGSETHRKIFEMASEVLVKTAEDLTGNSTEGQKGYVMGKIVFEVGSFLLPFTKAGTLMQVTKAQVLQKLLSKTGLLRPGARGVAGHIKQVCEGPGRCFMAGEQVLTDSGGKNIENIKPGDVVWSQNEYDSAQSGWRRVTAVQVSHPREIHHITYELRGPPESETGCEAVLSPATETLRVTGEHPFWVERGGFAGFVPVKDLRRGDVFLRAGGGAAVLTGMESQHAAVGETFTTYNLTGKWCQCAKN